jgi:parvulin-like peptidyl-prolyl isomerase
MSSQTARRPEPQRTTRPARARSKEKRYSRQTAHVEARRDGKPLIFGWGGHLSRAEKSRLQHRAIWAMTVLIVLIIVAVVVGYWVNLNIITPSLPITSVDGQQISQSEYRKLVALDAQMTANKIYGVHGLNAQRDSLQKQVAAQQTIIDNETNQINALNKQLQATPASDTAQRASLKAQIAAAQAKLQAAQKQHDTLNAQYQNMLQNTIPQEEQYYDQSQVGNDSVQWLQDDVLIRNWLATQSSSVQAKVEPTAAQVNKAIADFKANLPTTTTYSQFLSQDNISNADVYAMMTLLQRRQNMQNYLASLIKSPAYQVDVRVMTIDTQKDANNVLQQLKKGGDFAALAKKYSVDTATNTKGGYLGWIARGQYILDEADNTSGIVDNWIFSPQRYVNEISPAINENGAYHIIQILGIDPSRPIDSSTLQALKNNALTAWLLEQKALPTTKIAPVNQTMLLDTSNMPPGLPSSPPGQPTPTSPLTGGAP